MKEMDKLLLIELLDYPRKRIGQSMDLISCSHAGFLNTSDKQCLDCHQRMECTWMNHNDELVDVEEKSVKEIKRQLLIAVDVIESGLTLTHLAKKHCECENCVWLGKVRTALSIN